MDDTTALVVPVGLLKWVVVVATAGGVPKPVPPTTGRGPGRGPRPAAGARLRSPAAAVVVPRVAPRGPVRPRPAAGRGWAGGPAAEPGAVRAAAGGGGPRGLVVVVAGKDVPAAAAAAAGGAIWNVGAEALVLVGGRASLVTGRAGAESSMLLKKSSDEELDVMMMVKRISG